MVENIPRVRVFARASVDNEQSKIGRWRKQKTTTVNY